MNKDTFIKLAVMLSLTYIIWAGWYYYACEYFEIDKPSYLVVLTVVITFHYFTNTIKKLFK